MTVRATLTLVSVLLIAAGIGLKFLETSAGAPALGLVSGLVLLVSLPAFVLGVCGRDPASS